MPCTLEPNGTLSTWKVGGINVLFPQQKLMVGGKEKLRGGMPVCYPVFGSVPKTEAWRGVELPQHGLLRNTHSFEHESDTEYERHAFAFDACEGFPWTHSASVEVQCSVDYRIRHIVETTREPGDGYRRPMPLSFAIHPYFATHGKPFTITWDELSATSDVVGHDAPFYWAADTNRPIQIDTEHGTVTMLFDEGDYFAVCVWTDAVGKYICVEPVTGKPGAPHLLEVGDTRIGVCTLTYLPH